jgi:hypothetical protein
VLGADLEFGAWKLVLQSYQLLKVILDRSAQTLTPTLKFVLRWQSLVEPMLQGYNQYHRAENP